MACLYLLSLGLLLWAAHRHDRLEHGRELDADLSAGLHSLGLHLQWGLEALLHVAGGADGGPSGDGAQDFEAKAAAFRAEHPGIVSIFLTSEDLVVREASPLGDGEPAVGSRLPDADARPLFLWAVATDEEASLAWIQANEREETLDAFVPLFHRGAFVGLVGARHSCRHLLGNAVPPHVLQKARVSLVGGDGSVVCTAAGSGEGDPRFTRDGALPVSGQVLRLRVTHHRSEVLSPEVWGLVLACFLLTVGTVYGIWRFGTESAERELADEAVRRERDNLLNVFEAMPDGVAIVSPDLRVQYVNPVLVKDFGPYEGRSCHEYFHGASRRCNWCMMDNVVAGEAIHSEWCYPRNNRTYDLIDTPVTNPDGAVAKLKMFRDITDRTKAEHAAGEAGRRRLSESEGLRRVAEAILQDRKREEILGLVCAKAQQLTGGRGSAVALVEGDVLRVAAWSGEPPVVAEAASLEGSFGGVVAKTGEPLLVNDLRAYDLACTREPRPESLLAVPLRVGGDVLGVLDVVGRPEGFGEEELHILSHLADQASIALENERLRRDAERGIVAEERQRLAQELHDSVTQALYSMALFGDAARIALDRGQTDVGKSHLDQLRELAREAMKELRLLIYELHPPALEKEGLAGALRTRLATVEARAGLRTEFTVEGEAAPLPLRAEEGLYRLAQEALNNVVKHAKARSVQVRISYADGRVGLQVEDDGVGFDAPGGNGGFGIASMRERMEAVGGTVCWETAPGRGTKVTAGVPLTRAGEG